MRSKTKESFTLENNFCTYYILLLNFIHLSLLFSLFNFFPIFSRNSPAPAVTAASVTNIQATEVSVPQVNSSESSGGKEMDGFENACIMFGCSLHLERWLC